MRYLKAIFLFLVVVVVFACNATIAKADFPTTDSISPTSKNVGDPTFSLIVNGTNFSSSSVVNLNGSPRTTTFISTTQLSATILASDLLTAGSRSITVFNPDVGVITGSPLFIAISSDGNHVYVAGSGGGDLLQKFNATTFQLEASVALPQNPTSLAVSPDGTYIFVATCANGCSGSNQLTKYTASSLSQVAQVGAGGGFTDIVVSPDSQYVYAISYNDLLIKKMNASDLAVVASATSGVFSTIPAPHTSRALSVAISSDGNFVYVGSINDISGSTIFQKFNAVTLVEIIHSNYTNGSTLRDMAVSPDGLSLFAINAQSGSNYAIQKFSTMDFSELAHTTLGGTYPREIAISPNGSYVYVSSYGGVGSTLQKLNTTNLSQVTSSTYAGGNDYSFGMSSNGSYLYGATKLGVGTNYLTKFDTSNLSILLVGSLGGTSNAQTLTVNNPVPTISSITPNSGVVGGSGFIMTVDGTNFVSNSVVNFAGSPRATSFVNATQLTATILPADLTSVGNFNITVTNPAPGGGTSNPVTFTVGNPVPTISLLSPSSKLAGSPGFNLTVTGTNFLNGGASTIYWGGLGLSTNYITSTSLTTFISSVPTAGIFSITVVNSAPGGGTSNEKPFTVNNPVPTIIDISPNSKNVGSAEFEMTVNGTNFVNSSVVRFAGSDRATTYVNNGQVTATIPASDMVVGGTFAITVFNPTPGGGTSGPATFTVNNFPPTTTSISPNTKVVGDASFTMTVNGNNFVSASIVRLNGSNRTTTFVDGGQLTATIPASDMTATGTFNITVFNPAPGGGTSNPQTFTVNNPVPTLDTISPSAVAQGSSQFTMTLTGTGFLASSVVRFNGSNRTTFYSSSTQLTATIPASDLMMFGSFPMTVFNPTPGGGVSNAVNLTVQAPNPLPTLNSISPNSKNVGDGSFTMTLNGTNFVSNSVARVAGSDRTTSFVNGGQLTATILASDMNVAGTFNITVFNPTPGGGTSNPITFTVNNLVPTTTSISPTSAGQGDPQLTMTVNGTHFVSNSVVKFNGVNRTTSFVSDTQLTATILTSDMTVLGAFPITVFNPAPGGGTSNSQTFTVVPPNPVPVITSLSPSSVNVNSAPFTLTVDGNNFIAQSSIMWEGAAIPTTYVSVNQLTTNLPSFTTGGDFNVTVFNPAPGGGTSNTKVFSVLNLVPTLTSISPEWKTVGNSQFTMTLIGTNFVGTSVAKFEGSARATTFVDDTHLTAIIPTTDMLVAGVFNITVTNPAPGGGTSNALPFIVNPTNAGSIKLNKITVGGDATFNFTTGGFGYNPFNITTTNGAGYNIQLSLSPGVYSFLETPPSGWALTGNSCNGFMTVSAGQTSICNVTNTYGGVSGPHINNISPSQVAPNSTPFTLTVNGLNFIQASEIHIDGLLAMTNYISATQLSTVLVGSLPEDIYYITVVNPPGPNEGTSNAVPLTVGNPNEPGTGSLIIHKVANGGNGTFNFLTVDSTWFPGCTNPTTGNGCYEHSSQITTTAGAGTDTQNNLEPGTYSVTETSLPSGWGQVSSTCNSVNVVADQTAECTVTNAIGGVAAPTATNLAVSSDRCPILPAQGVAYFSWNYNDADNDLENKFQIQIDNNAGFTSPEVDRTFSGLSNPSGTLNQQAVNIKLSSTNPTSPGCDFINYGNQIYHWRVKVWQEDPNSPGQPGLDSGWVTASNYTTASSPGPYADFTYSPSSPAPLSPVAFTNTSACYTALGPTSCISYDWAFGDGGTSTVTNPSHTYAATGVFPVVLKAYDSIGYCQFTQNVSVTDGNPEEGNGLPYWIEISPF